MSRPVDTLDNFALTRGSITPGRRGEDQPDPTTAAVTSARQHPAHIPADQLEPLDSFGTSRRFYRHTPTGREYVADNHTSRLGGIELVRLDDNTDLRITTTDRRITFLTPADATDTLEQRRALHVAGIALREQHTRRRLEQAAASARPVTFAQARAHGHDYTVAQAAAIVLDHGGTITRHGDHIIVTVATVNANRGEQLSAAATLYAAEPVVLAALGRTGKVGRLPDRHITPNGALI